MSDFRTRQAPSPTGYLHLGFLRQLIFTKLLAKVNQGTFYFRLEDTDQNRLIPESAKILVQYLKYFGCEPDEGLNLEGKGKYDEFYQVYQDGEFGPYIQSHRLSIYHEHAQNLIDKGLAYWNFLSPEEKEELQTIKQINKQPINYFKICSEKFGEQIHISVIDGLSHASKPVLMYKLQRSQKIVVDDLLLGKSEFDLSLEEDFGILKSDGFPTYHLAHLIDDHLMQTTVALRAQEWFPSISKHVAMFRDYWGKEIQYLHPPFILGATGNKKMSKRDGNVNMDNYIQAGYLPEAIINYLVFLGWNPGTEKELYLDPEDFSSLNQEQRMAKLMDNLAVDFSIEKLSKSPARFNIEKLNWFNREYIKMLTLPEFCKIAKQHRSNTPTSISNFRIGDYVIPFDPITHKVFCKIDHIPNGDHYLLGGGRQSGETPQQNILREVNEETAGYLKLNQDKLKFITDYKVNEPFQYDGEMNYDGRHIHVYYYEINEADIDPKKLVETESKDFELVEINEFVLNSLVSYPILKDFFDKEKMSLPEPTQQIKRQYLAWLLDKNRITTFSEFGSDSDCILNWQQPTTQDLTWKKSTNEQSLENLGEIANFITELLQKPESIEIKNRLLSSIFSQTVDNEFANSVEYFETSIKNWLNENQKPTGDYLWPLRVALSGKAKSPSPFEILSVLSDQEIQKRLDSCLS